MDFQKIQLPIIKDQRGNLTFIESTKHIPFDIKRVFWIYDVPGGEIRGGHAYKKNHEFIIALSGSFDVVTDNGYKTKIWQLNRSYNGLLIPSGNWRQLKNFSTNALALVLSSTLFDKLDYVYDYKEFLKLKSELSNNIIKNKTEDFKYTQNHIDYTITNIDDCKLINLDINHRDKGNITVVESNSNANFDIKRVYYLYDIPGGEERGGHAHKELKQLLIAASGSFDVVLDDGKNRKTYHLNRSFNCLEIVPGIWRELKNFSSGSICLVLASQLYDESDYIRDYKEFLTYKK
jgi:dTDP-4-dehydrorhamnose 3,5-epimerase-like enzyme